ncbi:MAG: glycosyltransferase [Giesbergeria sp.]|uniref:glycosyltransferase family protein n=1 Tax=Giesbergeria sp. TaxID=2818473 RepID=UPI00262113BA|nr:glycosyltransferase [Giesbergeria sp.]MDD2608882.1 glycosyltransferase [Giesbergeria sp.]
MTKKSSFINKTTSSSLLTHANRAFREGKYTEAINFYEKAIKNTPKIAQLISTNIILANKRLALLNDQKSKINAIQDGQANRNNSSLTDNVNFFDLKANKYIEDIRFFKKFINDDDYNKKSSNTDWDTRELISITYANTKIKIPEKIYVVPAINKPRNTTRYRAYNLAAQIKNISSVEIIDYKNLPTDFFENLLKEKSIVICQRLALTSKIEENFLNKCRETPAIIIYDIDDQIFDNSELEDWRVKNLLAPPKSYYKAMLYADHFFVSTKELRRKIETLFKRPTHVINNVISQEVIDLSNKARLVSRASKKDKDLTFTIGYGSGSFTHDRDLSVALEGISLFLEKNTNTVFHCVGDVNLPELFQKKFKDQIKFTPKCTWSELPNILAQFDIQIIPLEAVSFNEYKSHIRFLESSIVGVPVVASNVGEQSLTIINGFTGILTSNSKEDWFGAIDWMYKNTLARQVMGDNAKNYVHKYWTEHSHLRAIRLREVLEDASLGLLRDKISIIAVIYNPLHDVKALFESIQSHVNVPYELLIWINTESEDINNYILDQYNSSAYIINVGHNVGKAHAANHLFKIASERFIVGLDDDYIVPEFWAEGMISATKAVPKLGWLSTNLTKDSSGIRGYGKSATYSGGVSIYLPSGVGGWVVFTTASSRELIGYYKEHGLYGGIDGDFNRRARALGLTTGYVRNVVGKHKTQRDNSLAWELFKQRIQDNMRTHGKDSDLVTDKFVDFFAERPKSLTCSIKISTSVTHNENVWGDTHFANSLKAALEELDYSVDVSKHENWYSNTQKPDVVIHLFGLHEYEPDPYSLNIIWIISHVDKINAVQLKKYDYVFCASKKTEDLVRQLVPEIKTEVLHQCTDHKVFFPDDTVSKDIDVLFVGNSRRIYRDSVKYAVESNVDLHVWGTKWEQFIPKNYIKGQSIASDEVANLYRRSKIVLNDHWADQNEFGLVNNRIFDAFACGAAVLTDENQGLVDIFGKIEIPTFKDQRSFSKNLNRLLIDEKWRNSLVKSAQEFSLNQSTFSARAKIIHNAVKFLINFYVDYKSEFLYKLRNLS